MRRLAVIVLLVLVAPGCNPRSDPTTTIPTPAATTTTVAPASVAPCLSGELAFATTGLVAAVGRDQGDATTLTGVRWEGHDGCERLVAEFHSADAAPASTLGPSGATILDGSGIVRLRLPDAVDTSAIADSLVESALIDRIYVARSADGGLVVDVHLNTASAVAVRAFDVTSPARLVVDLKPEASEAAVHTPPAIAPNVVALSPSAGPGLYPIQVSGYIRRGAGAVRVRLTDGDTLAYDRSVATIGDREIWQSFDIRIADGPSGEVELFVGEIDAFDEPAGGVVIVLDLP